MFWLQYAEYPTWLNLLIFALGAAVVWLGGSRISLYAGAVSDRTGLGHAFMGVAFLALATSSPEIATTTTAAAYGDASLVLNNLFGDIVVQTAILAVVDLILIRGALTYFVPKPVLGLQGTMLVALLGLTVSAMVLGELVRVGNVGLWAVLLFTAYGLALYLIHRYGKDQTWEPTDELGAQEIGQVTASSDRRQADARERAGAYGEWPVARLGLHFAGATMLILAAGITLARVGESLASQTGLGGGFIGSALLATATALPEISATTAAIRLNDYSLAVSNILGSNSMLIALVLIADLFYRRGPILDAAGPAEGFSAGMGIVVTSIYLIGLIERRDRTFLRMGIDSLVVLPLVLFYLFIQYTLR